MCVCVCVDYTDLTTSSLGQRQAVFFSAPYSLLLHKLKQLSSDAEQFMISGKLTIKASCVNYVCGKVWSPCGLKPVPAI